MPESPNGTFLIKTCLFLLWHTSLAAGFAQDFFTYDPAAVGNGFAQAPVLDNGNASEVADILSANELDGLPLAVRVREELTNVAARAVITDFHLGRLFGDFVGPDRVALTAASAKLALSSPLSRNAFAGGFNLYPNAELDTTNPDSLVSSQAPRFQILSAGSDFPNSRGRFGKRRSRRASMPVLFPGSPDFRNPAQGNSGAPNIRSALFTLPIQRLTFASLGVRGLDDPTAITPALHALSGRRLPIRTLPIVARFNNYGNAALGGGPSGTGFVQNAATPSNGQLLSRGDFQAQVLHYRFRGADGLVLFDGGSSVIGYSSTLQRDDIVTGWNASTVANDIISRGRYAFANLSNIVGDAGAESGDESPRSTELAGVVWSGVFDRSGTNRQLVLLVSNLSAVVKTIDFPKIGRQPVAVDPAAPDPDNTVINPGQHQLLNFHLMKGTWVFDTSTFIGLDNNRNGVGVGAADPPEN
jgi:hypothetical protein